MPRHQGRASPEAHEDLYTEIMQSANRKGSFIVETEDDIPDIEFEVKTPDKPTRNKLQRAMPSGLMDGIELPDDPDEIEDMDVEDIDLSSIDIVDMTFGEEATNTWLDIIADHYEHEYYSRSEVRNLFDALDDEYFVSAGSYLIELGTDIGPVTGFRRD